MKRFSFHPFVCEVTFDRGEDFCPKQLFKNIIKAPV